MVQTLRRNKIAEHNTITTLDDHHIGKKVDSSMTPSEILQAAGLAWEVETRPMYFVDKNGNHILATDKALVRTDNDTFMDTVSSDWKPNQNKVLFDLIAEFQRISNGAINITHAGNIKNGAIVWALADVDEEFVVFGKDRIRSKILFANPHKYGKCIDVRFTPTRLQCSNQLTMSLNKKFKADLCVKINHCNEFNPQVVFDAMNLSHDRLGEYKEMAEFLGSKQYNKESLFEYYNEVLGTKTSFERGILSRPAELAYEVLETQPGHEIAAGSFWQAFNSITYMTDHLQGRSAINRMENIWFGASRAKKLLALDKAIEFAQKV